MGSPVGGGVPQDEKGPELGQRLERSFPSIFWGSSRIRMGRLPLITSMAFGTENRPVRRKCGGCQLPWR